MENGLKTIGRAELFTDDWLLEHRAGIEFRVNHPTPREKSILLDKPWNKGEGSGAYTSVFRDGGKFKMYYRGVMGKLKEDNDETQCYCYAESDDGINWSEPVQDVFEYNGQKTNIVFCRSYLAHNMSPFLDTNPACPPEHKYKAVAGNSETGLLPLSSPDGIHWRKMREEGVIKDGAFDSHNVAWYDNNRGKYICYSRYFDTSESGEGVRAIQHCTSDDFLNWSPQIKNVYNEAAPRDDLYTNATVPIPGAEHILLSIPMRFMPHRKKLFNDEYDASVDNGVSDCVIMTSRDGVHWTRPASSAFILPGTDRRLWTQRNFIVARGVLETGDDFSFYVNEHYSWDDSYIRRYTVPRHRLISLHAETFGCFVSKPFLFKGSAMKLNYATSAAGDIRLTLSAEGLPDVKTGELYGNALNETVLWDGSADLSRFAGREVRLRAEMREADLYAFYIEP
jgi:hypothetical protein